VAAPPAEPKFEAGPPSLPPPTPAPAQRRFNFLIVGLTVLLATGLVGGLVLYDRKGSKHPIRDQTAKNVQSAYLDYYAAEGQVLKTLDIGPVKPFVTDAALKQEQTVLDQVVQSRYKFQVTAEHDIQVVVYLGGSLASVDDDLLRHTVRLDYSTGVPLGPEMTDTIHNSIALQRQDGRWRVDSVVGFGTGNTQPGSPVSYAAVSRGVSVPRETRQQIVRAYDQFWDANARAFSTLDSKALNSVEIDPELSKDRSIVTQLMAQRRTLITSVQHNYRIAMQDASTAWVYDTFADSSFAVDITSKKAIGAQTTRITRKSFRLRMVGARWAVDYAILNQ
jgi:hypothetical protein